MPFQYDDLISHRADDIAFGYTDTQMVLYNQSIGIGRDLCEARELPFVIEQPSL